MNVIVLGARIVGSELAHELVRAFVGARFTAEARHVRRLEKVKALEHPYGMPRHINPQAVSLPAALQREVSERLTKWDAEGGTRRLFAGDASLWTGSDEANWIGWLGVVDEQRDTLTPLRDLQAEVRRDGFTHALLLGMGGSSLCPEVWTKTFGCDLGRARASRARLHRPGADSRRSRLGSTSLARWSSSPASRARRSSPTSSRRIFSIA